MSDQVPTDINKQSASIFNGEGYAAAVCEHFYIWISPAGVSKAAHICQLCHCPDPDWLRHVVEVRLHDCKNGKNCLHCEYAEVDDPRK